MTDEKWSWNKFFIGISKLVFSKESAVWIMSTLVVYKTLENGFSENIKMTALIVWGVISIMFYFYPAISELIKKGNLNVDLSAKVGLDGKDKR